MAHIFITKVDQVVESRGRVRQGFLENVGIDSVGKEMEAVSFNPQLAVNIKVHTTVHSRKSRMVL